MPPGPVQRPPASGVPLRPPNNAVVGLDEQSVKTPSIPASGCCAMVIVTVTVSSRHGAVPVTVYAYAPAVIVAGSNIPPTTVLGPLQDPPASGVPPSCAKRLAAALVLQSVRLPLVPGSGGALMVIVTVATSIRQGAVPFTVYAYTPAVIVAGSNIPPTTVLGPLQDPPASGVPPSCAKRSTATPELHALMEPLVPALGGWFTVTATEELVAGQGAAAGRV